MATEIVVTPMMGTHSLAGAGTLTVSVFQMFFMPRGTKEHKKLGWFW